MTAETPATTATVEQAPIPFRTDPAVGAADFGTALIATVVLLGATYALLRWAQLRGWKLPRLTAAGAPGAIEVVESRRVGLHTTVHLLRVGGERVLVTESSRHASAVTLPPDSAGAAKP